jgi:hypothetical protein
MMEADLGHAEEEGRNLVIAHDRAFAAGAVAYGFHLSAKQVCRHAGGKITISSARPQATC